MHTAGITVIRHANWAVTWQESTQTHQYARNTDLAFTGSGFIHVDGSYDGPAEHELDGSGWLVMPGLVNVHSHPTSEPGNKGLLEELGSPRLGMSSLYEFMPVFRLGEQGARPATLVAITELLQSGVTTMTDLSLSRPGWVEDLARTGIRAFVGPMYRSAGWSTPDGHSVTYQWNEAAGEAGLRQALKTIGEARTHPSGRMDGMLCPSQVDTCSAELLRESLEAAQTGNMRLQIHAAQSLVEFQEITRRHGQTPIEWLDGLGLLGPDTIIGHGIFLNDHPWVHWPQGHDLRRLADSGAMVAHCPTVFARRGIALNHFGRYAKAGIPMGLGTDTFPLNMIEEMRLGCYAARLMAGDVSAASTARMFQAATVGGAKLLNRPELGRIAVGTAADFSVADLNHPAMQPLRDPLRSLIYSAGERPIRHVYVAGEQVLKDGQPVHINLQEALEGLAAAQEQALASAPERHWAGRGADTLSPLVLPLAP